jgi:hypothetical protein
MGIINIRILFLLVCFSLLIKNCQSYSVKDEKKYYFCKDKIFASYLKISSDDINTICDKLWNDPRILVSIQKDITIGNAREDLDNYYTRDSEEFFLKRCINFKDALCDNGFMISIYTDARKIRLTAGRLSKNTITQEQRGKIINSVKSQLSQEMYAVAIIKIIDLINSQSYYQPYQQTTSYRPPSEVIVVPSPRPREHSSGPGFFVILIFVICPCLCLCYALYYCYSKSQQSNYYSQTYTAESVHEHLCKLEKLLKDIKRNDFPHIAVDTCLLCMQQIFTNTQFEMNNYNPGHHHHHSHNQNTNYPNFNTTYNDMQTGLLPPSDPNVYRLGCGHMYHTNCFTSRNLSSCLMCVGNPQSSVRVPNTSNLQVVNEDNVKTLIQNLRYIYDRETLESYSRSYPNEFDTFNTTLALGLVGVWGITAIAATAIVADSMMSHNMYDNSGYNQGYGQGYNQGYNQAYNQGNYNQQDQGWNNYNDVNVAGGNQIEADTAGDDY